MNITGGAGRDIFEFGFGWNDAQYGVIAVGERSCRLVPSNHPSPPDSLFGAVHSASRAPGAGK